MRKFRTASAAKNPATSDDAIAFSFFVETKAI